jgi:hypothetical protein
MKKTVVLLILAILFFSFWGCKSENKSFDDFFEKEKQNLTVATKRIVTSLGLKNFEVLIYAHKSINNSVVSKSTSYTDWSGIGYNPEGSAEVEGQTPPAFKDMSNLHGRMSQRTMLANYEPNTKREIAYDYFSILIIFESINDIKKDELFGILNSHIVNMERGDCINIISKEEFINDAIGRQQETPKASLQQRVSEYDNIHNTLNKTKTDLNRKVDINKDGKINCVDAALLFYKHYPNKNNIRIITNNNYKNNWHHLFNSVFINGVWKEIEPQTYWAGYSNYWMQDSWSKEEYDRQYNRDVTAECRKYVRRNSL